MATILTLANQKGGAGKSTLTALLANTLSQDYEYRVLVVDCDLQASLTHLRAYQHQKSPGTQFSYDLTQLPLSKLASYCQQQQQNYDVIMVDIPGALYGHDGSSGEITKFMFICDVVLIPIYASFFDYDSASVFYNLLMAVKNQKAALKSDMEIFGFINQYSKAFENKEMEAKLKADGFAMLKTKISQLIDYKRLANEPKSLLKSSVSNPRIKREFGEFADEVVSLLQEFQ